MLKSTEKKDMKRSNGKMNNQRQQNIRPNEQHSVRKPLAQINQPAPKKNPPKTQPKPRSDHQTTQPKPRNKPVQNASQRRMTNKAYNNAVVHRSVKGRKRGSRGRNFIMYYILAGIVIITVLIILSNTVLFNCSSITVEGNSRYTAEQIITQSGLEMGKNLLHTDTEAARARIYTAFSYLDSVEVQKCYPTRINIVVREAEKWFQVKDGAQTAAVSRLGRIVELGGDSSLPAVIGYDPEQLIAGAMLSSNESGKGQLPMQLLEAAEKCGVKDITVIDMTDRFDISIDCGDNITLEIGGIADIERKLTAAVQAMKTERSGVVLDLRQPDKLFARDKVDEQQILPTLGGTEEPTGEPTGEPAAEGSPEAA